MKILKRLLKKNKNREGLTLALEAYGHRFYTFGNALQMPQRRVKYYTFALEDLDRNITRDDLKVFCDKLEDAFNKNKKADQAVLIKYMRELAELEVTTKQVLNVANAVILIDDEPITDLTKEHADLKGALCEKHEDIEDFFFGVGATLILPTGKESSSFDIGGYLRRMEVRKIESQFFKYLGRNIYKTLLPR